MNFILIRHIVICFLGLTFCFVLASLIALSSLETAATLIQTSEIEDALGKIRSGQVFVVLLSLGGLITGIIGMLFSAHRASRILLRIRQATNSLGEVVLDEISHSKVSAANDCLDLHIHEMMLKIKDSQKRYLDASPLTRLPGNLAIEEVLKEKMSRGEKFALCYIDLDDFKAYNDKYGYARGSELIKMTGEVIYRAKDEKANKWDFVGHIGGDDFVLITSPDKVEHVCRAIIDNFDRLIPSYYHPDDCNKGYIESTDRFGIKRQFPVMSISIAVVSDVKRAFKSPIEIAKVATQIKDYVKTLPGSNYLVDRREIERNTTSKLRDF